MILKSRFERMCKEMIGSTFLRLKVVRFSHVGKQRNYYWLCSCECGKTTKVKTALLRSGGVRSCGCLRAEVEKDNLKLGPKKTYLGDGISNANCLYSTYIFTAKSKHRDFNLTKKEFFDLTKQNCYYCGREPFLICRHRGDKFPYTYNGIDRINNDLGYIIENCVSCCCDCNRAKRTRTKEEFLNWILLVYNHIVSKSLP